MPAGALTSAGNKRQVFRPVGQRIVRISCDPVTASVFWRVPLAAASCVCESSWSVSTSSLLQLQTGVSVALNPTASASWHVPPAFAGSVF
jgi:hypothetical protein